MLATLLLVGASLGLGNFAASVALGMSGVDRQVRARVALAFGLFEAGMPIVGLLIGRGLSHVLGGSAHIIGGVLLIGVGAEAAIAWLRSRGLDSWGGRGGRVRAASVGGASVGGASVGGASVGGASVGGARVGGASVGGASVGGASVGGASVGGASVGGGRVGRASVGGGRGESFTTERMGRLLLLAGALGIDNLVVGFALGADRSPVILSVVVIGLVSVGMSLVGLELGARLGERVGGYSELIGGIVLIVVGLALAVKVI